jgi:hypothetical protein
MRMVKYGFLAALTVSLVGVSMAEEKKEDAKPQTIKQVMKKVHSAPKGEQNLKDKFAAGKTSEAETKDILAAYADLGKNKPPQGEEAAWKEKTGALLAAAKDVAAKKDGAPEAFKKAVACMGCHSVFRPKP